MNLVTRLREARDEDRPALLDLWVEAWAQRPWFEAHLATLRKSGALTLVAIDETDRPLGFVCIDPLTGWLDQIAVSRAAQGRGTGRALMTRAKQIAPHGIDLDVNKDNAPALDFYRAHGFVPVGTGRNPRSGLATVKLSWRPQT
jgi:putative acetyltransferase